MVGGKQAILRRLHQLLGGWPEAQQPTSEIRTQTVRDGFVVKRLHLTPTRSALAMGDVSIPAILTRPANSKRCPVVLYCHAHGNNYAIGKEELLDGRPGLPAGAYGPVLAKLGMAAVCIDLPCFGERQDVSEQALAKSLLWQGDTLFGVMLRELATVLDWIGSRPDLDASRIATLGLSMGCTTGWWLAALDTRVRAVAGLCCLADLASLIEIGAHDLHGHYMTVPGLTAQFSTADIASLIVPRPHLSCIGANDPLTPPSAVAKVDQALTRAYLTAGHPERWCQLVEPDSGHIETAHMRQTVLAFLQRYLAGTQPA